MRDEIDLLKEENEQLRAVADWVYLVIKHHRALKFDDWVAAGKLLQTAGYTVD